MGLELKDLIKQEVKQDYQGAREQTEDLFDHLKLNFPEGLPAQNRVMDTFNRGVQNSRNPNEIRILVRQSFAEYKFVERSKKSINFDEIDCKQFANFFNGLYQVIHKEFLAQQQGVDSGAAFTPESQQGADDQPLVARVFPSREQEAARRLTEAQERAPRKEDQKAVDDIWIGIQVELEEANVDRSVIIRMGNNFSKATTTDLSSSKKERRDALDAYKKDAELVCKPSTLSKVMGGIALALAILALAAAATLGVMTGIGMPVALPIFGATLALSAPVGTGVAAGCFGVASGIGFFAGDKSLKSNSKLHKSICDEPLKQAREADLLPSCCAGA